MNDTLPATDITESKNEEINDLLLGLVRSS